MVTVSDDELKQYLAQFNVTKKIPVDNSRRLDEYFRIAEKVWIKVGRRHARAHMGELARC